MNCPTCEQPMIWGTGHSSWGFAPRSKCAVFVTFCIKCGEPAFDGSVDLVDGSALCKPCRPAATANQAGAGL